MSVTEYVMKHEAIQDLSLIIKESREELREALLKAWEEKWIYHTEKTQYVLNKSILNSEETDFVWYKLAELCAHDLIEQNVVDTNTTNTSFSCEILALRRPNGKLEENQKSLKKVR
jgi:hypothetical protein